MTKTVRIIAPASRLGVGAEQVLREGVEYLVEHGFKVQVQENIFNNKGSPFYAAGKEDRLSGLRDAIMDPDADILWAYRGGVGCAQIADLCIDLKPPKKKILIGFSDITELHLLFNQNFKMASIHGPVITSLMQKYPENIADIKKILNGDKTQIELEYISGDRSQSIEGVLSGGNLTIFNDAIGTKLHPLTKDKILFFEDVGIKGYAIARNLTHLQKASLLDDVKAIIFGDFTDSDNHLDDAIKYFVEEHPKLPIYKAEGIGHGKQNKSLLFGQNAKIKSGKLEFKLKSK
jgi:muramoyltetrapeptide carboxypeptidase LdcA involved in peptidoglycan recycling